LNNLEQEKLVLENLKLVPFIARQFSQIPEVIEELISEGNIALVEASRTFSENRGIQFNTYAGSAIRYKLNRYIKNLPQNVVSLESVVNQEGFSLLDTIEDTGAKNAEREVIKREKNEQLQKAINGLETRDAWIISRYFGLNGEEAITIEAIGDYLGLSRSRIYQIVKETLETLKKRLDKLAKVDNNRL
jgi:RNA polymerase sigma factor (sigma-70 family)